MTPPQAIHAPAYRHLDHARMLDAIAAVENGNSRGLGGRCNLTPSVWYAQTTYPYDFSRNPILCRQVEAKHLDWLIHGLERAGIVVSADTIYTVWLKGLTGGSKLIRAGHIPESAYRVANCYDSR